MSLKDRARELRTQGKSYGEISKDLHVAKSTLFSWISDLNPNPAFDNKIHLAKIRKLASKKLIEQRLQRTEIIRQNAQAELKGLDSDDKIYMRSLAAMLYWSEGSKGRGTMGFANTDPMLSKLFITLLRKSFTVNEEKFRIRLHLHYYHDIEESKRFWSNLLEVPLSQFGKIYIKPRSKTRKFRQNFAGICFIRYHSEALRTELLELGKEIAFKYVPVAQLD